MVAGDLTIRDSDPSALAQPTTISGTVDDQTGTMTVTSFETPTISFSRPVQDIITGTAHIDADFSPVGPGTGTIDDGGNVVIRQSLTVDLHIEVVPDGTTTPITLPGDCTASPVTLELRSSEAAPYDPETGRLTLRDVDFRVPPLTPSASCDPLIGDRIDEELSGPGHSISLAMTGVLPVPPPAGCATTTDLVADPAGTSQLGSPLVLTAIVTPVVEDEDCVAAADAGEPLTGEVDYFSDGDFIGSATLDGGVVATLTVGSLGAGEQDLTARYRGAGSYSRSPSSAVAHLVTAPHAITTTLPPFIEIGSGSHEFDVTFNSSGFSSAAEDVRLDMTATRISGLFFPTMMTVEAFTGGQWTPATLMQAGSNRTLMASLTELDIAGDSDTTVRLRVSVGVPNPAAPEPGPVDVAFEVVPAAAPLTHAPAPGALIRGSGTTNLVPATRVVPTLTLGVLATPGITPHTMRQGATVVISPGRIMPSFSSNPGSGYIEVFLDGAPVDISRTGPGVLVDSRRVAVTSSATTPTVMFQLPPHTPTGSRQVTVRYSGSAIYQPAQVSSPITVVPSTGTLFECRGSGTPPMRMRANVVAQGNLPPSAPAGTDIALDHLTVRLMTDRSQNNTNAFSGLLADGATTDVGSPTLIDVGFDFGPSGEGTATGVARSFGSRMPNAPDPGTDVDQILDPVGEVGTVQIEGEVGDVVPVTLDAVRIDMVETIVGIAFNLVCAPVGDPIVLGQVRVSGVGLSVAPTGVSRAGAAVTLTADVGDDGAVGVMEFRDGETTIGVVPVMGRRVTFTTDDLVVGDRALSARFFSQPVGPVQVSAVVAHRVLPEHDCSDFAVVGSGAVVRLVYLELLGRCPDQVGFDFWVDRLDGGISPEVFARAIAATDEAVGRVVDDGYRTMLGRSADAVGRAFWTGRLQGHGRYDQLLADLGASDEFWSQAGSTNTGFVTRVYDRLLHRSPDQAGLAYWVARLDAGTSRRALISNLANLDEPLGVLVTSSYGEILGRVPFAGERRDGVVFLRATGDRSGLYAQLIGRPEFSARAQGFPNLEV